MYDRKILHLIQDALYRTGLIPDCFGNDDLSPVVLTMKFVSEDNCKERSHLIVDFSIFRFLGLRQVGQELFCDPSLDDCAIPPCGSNLVAKLQSSSHFSTFIGPAMDLKRISDNCTGSYDFVPPLFLWIITANKNIAAHSFHHLTQTIESGYFFFLLAIIETAQETRKNKKPIFIA